MGRRQHAERGISIGMAAEQLEYRNAGGPNEHQALVADRDELCANDKRERDKKENKKKKDKEKS